MILKRIFINNFGGLRDKNIELSSGMNVIYGMNEAEKNILFIFIKNMFFGIASNAVEKNGFYAEENGVEAAEKYGGTIWFQTGEKNYRLTREFGAEINNCELLCEDDGALVDGDNGALEMLLDGLGEAGFDNLVLIEALSGHSSGEMAKEIQGKLAILSKSGDQLLDLGRADQMLKMWRKGYLTQKERGQKAVRKEQEKLASELEVLESELDSLRDQKGQVNQEQAKIYSTTGKDEAAELTEQLAVLEKKNLGMVIAGVLAIIVGIVGIAGRFQVTDEMSKMGMDVCILAAAAAVIYTLTARRKLRMEFARQKKKKVYLQSQQEKLKSSQADIDEIYDEKLTAFTNVQSEYQEYETEAALPTCEDLEIQALNLAMDSIGDLSRELYLQKGRKIRVQASRILRELTAGKYVEFYGDGGQSIELSLEEGTILAEEIDREELELLYFSIRMAASELFADNREFPVVVDDVFQGKNQDYLTAVAKWMNKQSRQMLLFTSNKKTAEIFGKEN